MTASGDDFAPGPDFTEAVIKVLEALEPGEVLAYGEVAAEAGYPGAARAVGNLLRNVPGTGFFQFHIEVRTA